MPEIQLSRNHGAAASLTNGFVAAEVDVHWVWTFGDCVATLLGSSEVPMTGPPKRLDLARDAAQAQTKVPGLIVANWVDGRIV
jgi:hypothetical protein